jgi:predicted TIM-barrel fold metal-dependent hydrolase
VDLSKLPVTDAHCHPFTSEHQQLTEQQLVNILMFRLEGGAAPEAADTITTLLFLREAAELLDCSPTVEDVVAARNEQAARDYPGYISHLFSEAGIQALLPDTGYPYWTTVTIDDYSELVTRQALYEVFRVESVFSTRNGIYMSEGTIDFAEYLERFRAACFAAVNERGCVGLKTVIAYRTGLAILPVSYKEAKAAYSSNTDIDLRAQKTVRDYLFKVTAQLAAELGVPMVIHTGFTALTKPWSFGNPTDLVPILTDPDLTETTFVLLHGGYPWTSAAGYIATNHPNVYVDLSEFNHATSFGVERQFEEILQFAPFTKLTFGSDGVGIPELNWYATVLAKRALGNILDRFVKERLMRPEQAEDYATHIFYRTARKLYGLPHVNASSGSKRTA